MDDEGAIAGLKRLGLTAYEARVFLALQKLGTGTANEISDVVDVPRSQVYGAAENLEERGLLEIQQSTPTVYRPVSLERARTRLLDQLAETGAETFDYLDTVQETEAPEEPQSESLWLVRGADAVSSRAVELTDDADEHVFYAASEVAMLDDSLVETFARAAERGVSVVVASANPAVRQAVDERFQTGAIATCPIPPDRDPDVAGARVLLADDETMLLSVHSPTGGEDTEEVAFWSSGSTFATVLGGFLQEWFTIGPGEV